MRFILFIKKQVENARCFCFLFCPYTFCWIPVAVHCTSTHSDVVLHVTETVSVWQCNLRI